MRMMVVTAVASVVPIVTRIQPAIIIFGIRENRISSNSTMNRLAIVPTEMRKETMVLSTME